MTHDENRISDLIDGGLHDKSAIDRAKYELHLRRIAAIEEAAKNDTGGWYEQQAFIRGAQHVIEHPERYGLVPAAHTAALQERVKELEEIIVGINSCQMVGITWPNELKQKVEKIWEAAE